MILREGSPDASHETAYGKIETRRAVLALIVAVGRKFHHLGGLALVPENDSGRPINISVSLPALLVMKASRHPLGKSAPTHDESVRYVFVIAREPCDRSDRARNKQKAI